MGTAALTPLLFFALSSLITIWALGQKQCIRGLSLLPTWLFNLLSLSSCRHLTWPGGMNSTYAILIIYYFFHTLQILILDYHPPRSTSFINRYKLWNNPRRVEARSLFSLRNSPKSRLSFALKQCFKIFALFTTDAYLIQGVISTAVFAGAKPSDFAPYYELLLFRPLTGQQAVVRAVISMSWIWTASYLLETSHCILSILFVALLRWDEPEEWPSIWGHPRYATSVRGFWGKTWNRITIPTFAFYAQHVLDKFGIGRKSGLGKIVLPFLIFFMSGLSHGLAGWAVGDVALERDMLFFMINFLACACESWVGKTRWWKDSKRRMPSWLLKMAGFLYVCGFFFMVVPLWLYPKIYGALGS
ncbi:hypothetical protein QBC40DRAFT_322801 [Triangularia verruculosa]|uniref:Wax synthase domain-containing protein n=1 Tax=Triangularia verruculosa TaxID=2587418 RepID=A0AAN6XJT2_9PEZI|nr:hypothetical protein QBC40DRAFT_322801 [Triangularia verruculosa]